MISYSSDSIFHEDSKYAILIDMRASMLYLLKIENVDKSPWKMSKRLRMSQGSILHAQNLDLRLRAQPSKNRKYVLDPRKNAIKLNIMQGPALYAQNCQMSLQSLSPKKEGHLLYIEISLKSL
jgi:hypothetical protein